MMLRLNRFGLYYPLRVIGSYFVVLILSLYSLLFNGFTPYRLLLIGVFFVYPHVIRFFTWRNPQDRVKIERRAFLFDSFLFGLIVHHTGFAPAPSFALITVGLVNALAVYGFRQMFFSAVALVVGIAVPMLFGGLNFSPNSAVAIDVAASVFLFVYFMFFGYAVYNSNALLAQSRTELREQKAILEIEKLRSDALLLNLVPIGIAAEMKDAKRVDFTVFDPVTLLAVDFCGFSRTLKSQEPKQVLAHLLHCFKAFDAIAGRHGFEKFKTLGDRYLAVAGVPRGRDGDAAAGIDAALEMRQFLTDLNVSRRAHGKFLLEARIALHTGSAVGGVVETEKMSYDLWGDSIKILLRLLEEAPIGQVVISELTRRSAGEGFASTPAGSVGTELVFYNVEKCAA
jgi:class 3 adenylate cyclase